MVCVRKTPKAAAIVLAGMLLDPGMLTSARAAELVILSESNGNFLQDCAGKDVALSGSNTKIILTGGCQSVTVSGRNNQILAEIASGGELTVLRNGNAVIWTKMGDGPSPTVSADRSNLAIQFGTNGVNVTETEASPQARAGEPMAEPAAAGKTTAAQQPAARATAMSGTPSPSLKPRSKAEPKAATASMRVAKASKVHAKAKVRRGRVPLVGSVLFAANSITISPKSVRNLRHIAAKIKHSGRHRLRLVGHADAAAPADAALSKRRAQAVAGWLIRHAGLSRQTIRVEAAARAGAGMNADKSAGRVNIIALPSQGGRKSAPHSHPKGAHAAEIQERAIIDLKDSPASSWNDESPHAEAPRHPFMHKLGKGPRDDSLTRDPEN
jgi:outer membrane protein OmpA-like peptidoglycan-associated protein